MIVEQVLIASAMILATTLTHGGGTALVLKLMQLYRHRRQPVGPRGAVGLWRYYTDVRFVAGVSLVMFLTSLLEIGLWAAVYLRTGALADFPTALYFSAVTFAAVGYGDVTLPAPWQLLSALQGANGVLLFGWSASLIFAAVREVVVAAGYHESKG